MPTSEIESSRIEALQRYHILDTKCESTFDRITALTASILGVPYSCVSLVDHTRVWFKSRNGVDAVEVPRVPGLCDTAIEQDAVYHLRDAREDPIAKSNPLVDAEGGIRFYVGVPLKTSDGYKIGTLCAFGPEPRDLPADEESWIAELGDFVMHEIEARRVRSELEHTEGALLQAQRLGSIGLVASGVAHDFNNLLCGIIGNAGLLQAEVSEAGHARKLVDEIDTVARRAAELVGQVLAYAGREEGDVHVPVDVNSLVQQTRYMLDSVIQDRTRLELSLTPGPAVVVANPASVRQLIMNLITNASESYEGQTGIVRLSTKRIDDKVQLTVEDHGCGMTPDMAERIFEPFYTSKAEGRGLGLAVARRILESANGDIVVESKPGQGTRFRVTLPASDDRAVNESAPSESGGRSAGAGTVLVVDDQTAILNVARRILRRADYSVLCATDGMEAIRLLDSNRDKIGVALLDMSMPVLSGADTLVELRKIVPGLRIILSSGHTEEQVRAKFDSLEIDGFLKKPYGPGELLEKISGQASA